MSSADTWQKSVSERENSQLQRQEHAWHAQERQEASVAGAEGMRRGSVGNRGRGSRRGLRSWRALRPWLGFGFCSVWRSYCRVLSRVRTGSDSVSNGFLLSTVLEIKGRGQR